MPAENLQPKFTYKRPPLYKKQYDAFFNPKRYSIIEGSTKSGKSVGCMAWLFEEAITAKLGQKVLWVSPVYSQAKVIFNRFRRGLSPDIYTANQSDLCLEFRNGTSMWFKGGDNPDSIYGDDYKAAVIDEAGRCKEDVFTAVRSTLTATSGKLRAIGNVRGRKNWHYKMARKAQQGDPDYYYAKLTAYDAVAAGVLPEKEIEDAKNVLPEYVFKELYLAEPNDDGGNPFSLKAIQECKMDDYSHDEPVVFGWDLAKSVDFTVGIGLDRQGRVCRFERFQLPWSGTKIQIREVTGKNPCAIDATGVGDPVVEDIQRDLARLGNGDVEGFKFTSLSKQQLMEGLAVAIQQKLIKFSGDDIIRELESFEYEITRTGYKYSAPEGMHDDCVCALALAWHKYKQLYSGAVIAPSIEWL